MERYERHTVNFIRKIYCEYYSRARLDLPDDFKLREFAAQLWGSKSYIRHMAFSTLEEVSSFLRSRGPRHFYYSCAKYLNPAAQDMDLKEWLGADLVFDIDADHLTQCGDRKFTVEDPNAGLKVTFVDDICIKFAAEETLKLVDALEHELGFEGRQIQVVFSGHRGFHVIVKLREDDPWFRASQDARRELVKYLKAEGVTIERLRPKLELKGRKRREVRELLPSTQMGGLRGRLARVLALMARRQGLKDLATALTSPIPPPTSKFAEYPLEELMNKAIDSLGIQIDEQVTLDVRRLVRVPGSLNGKTSLPATRIKVDDLPNFEVTEEMSPFKDLGKLTVVYRVDLPRLTILGERLSSGKRGERRRLPAPIALYLVSKDVAYLAPREG